MIHAHYHDITAGTPHEMGVALGRAFRAALPPFLAQLPVLPADVQGYLARCLELTRQLFPAYVAEIEGYAEGAEAPVERLWQMLLEDDVNALAVEKCTSLVTNNGRLLGHNEDWDPGAEQRLFLLRRTLSGRTLFELHYAGTLGGNSVSINSAGTIQMINSVDATPLDASIPRVPTNVIARFLADSADIDATLARLAKIPRMGGYAHTLVRAKDGKCQVVELSQREMAVSAVGDFPFAHANHYILPAMLPLNEYSKPASQRRYEAASCRTAAQMQAEEVMDLLDDPAHSLMNERTIAGMVLDLDAGQASVRLASEPEKGWVQYGLDFISSASE